MSSMVTIHTPLGPITVVSNGKALTGLSFGAGHAPDAPVDAVCTEAAAQLLAWFSGRLQDFDLPLVPAGTLYQRRVWTSMQTIPYGETLSYGGLARILGSGPRAVASACGRNPLPIIIPCHRVVASAGLGGYSGGTGLPTKQWLLTHEAGVLRQRPPHEAPGRSSSVQAGDFHGRDHDSCV